LTKMAQIFEFFDNDTNTWTFIVADPATSKAAIIDSVLDFDIKACTTKSTSADIVLAKVRELGLTVDWILETHVHADHLTASQYLKQQLSVPGHAPKICIGDHIVDVLRHWIPIFNADSDMPSDGSQFDHLFQNGEEFKIGNLHVQVVHTPGHTPACVAYIVDGLDAFVGDTIFNPAIGNARCDFPGGSPQTLFNSARHLQAILPDHARVYVGHDYPDSGSPVSHVTMGEHKANNCTLNVRVTEQEFVAANSDKMPVPRLLLPSLQVNLRAGGFGHAESNGRQYIKLPLNMF